MTATAEPLEDTPHQHARTLGTLGLRVLPIKKGHKRPPMASWVHAATSDAHKIDMWYKGLYGDAGVGIAMGPQDNGSYLFAVDLDRHTPGEDGFDTLADLEHTHGKLPETWRSITGSDGCHLIFSVPAGVTVRNQQASGQRIGPGVDVRGDGGQIVVAPTVHPDTGNQYAWEHGYAPWEIEVAEAPGWLLELVREPVAAGTPIAPQSSNFASIGDDIFALHRARWNWHTELTRLGWQHTDTRGNDTYWTRPGKNPRDGHSAILHGNDVLVIFTTSMPQEWRQAGALTRDGSGYAFGPFGFYAATQHHGNRSAAVQQLYTDEGITPPTDVDLSSLVAPAAVPAPDDYDAELLGMLLDWHTFADTDHRAEEWLWEPVIAAKRSTAIFAPGGIGKSLIVLRMVLDIVRTGVSVLYLDYEMTADDLDDRLNNMGLDNPTELAGHLHYALLPSLPAADTPEGGKAIRRLAQLVNAELVVIDTFARAVQGDENEADTVRQFYRQTGLHLKADGRAFIRIDHAGKDLTKGQRGTSAKNDDVDVVWQLRTTDTGYQLLSKKRRMGWVPETVSIDKFEDPFRLEIAGGNAYPVGTAELAKLLDELDVPADLSMRKARTVLQQAGQGRSNQLISAAQKYRRERSSTLHFADDLVAKSVPEILRNTAPDQGREHLSGTPGAEPAETTPDQGREHSQEHSGTPSDAAQEHCSPPKGGTVPSVTPAGDLKPTQSLNFNDVL